MNKKLLLITALAAGVFFSSSLHAQSADDMVAVYRWYNEVDRNYATYADGEFQEGQLLNWKYTDKTLLFYAYTTPGPNRVAVYRWTNPVTKDVVSLAEDEFADDEMLKMGYKEKTLQFYAPIRRGENRVPVYRWYIQKRSDWISIPEEGNTDLYIKKGYGKKTFQFYGIKRSVDESIYKQSL